MNFQKQRLWLFGAIFVVVIVILSLIAAPANNKFNTGSSYGREPDGYGAWYAFMLEKGTSIKRWQKPFQDLVEKKDTGNTTLLRVYSRISYSGITKQEEDWIEQGNKLVILGVSKPVTEAPFTSVINKIKIETARREIAAYKTILGDRFGAIVWQQNIGQGEAIFCSTPYLAANAYQDFQSNYEFLAQLVSNPQVLVDEYIHGYKDRETFEKENSTDAIAYLMKTPLFPAFIQVVIILLVAIFGFRRFGKPITPVTPVVDNSLVYIQALAGVLQKADSNDFVVEVIGKEERLQLQKGLGLGQIMLDDNSLVEAWVQTGRSRSELEKLLKKQSGKLTRSQLLNWTKKWQDIKPR